MRDFGSEGVRVRNRGGEREREREKSEFEERAFPLVGRWLP